MTLLIITGKIIQSLAEMVVAIIVMVPFVILWWMVKSNYVASDGKSNHLPLRRTLVQHKFYSTN